MTQAAVAPSDTLSIPRVGWDEHHARMVDNWTIDETPHVSIIAPTGNGKTVLVMDGLMKALRDEKVAYLDVKGWDKEINRHALHHVRRFPTRVERRWKYGNDTPQHFHFLAVDGPETDKFIARCYAEGQWSVILDEERAITDSHPSLGLKGRIDQLRLRGRGRVCVIACTQAPRWVVSSFYEQASHLYIGRIDDKRARRRLQEIGGDTDTIDEVVSGLGRYEYLYIGPLAEDGRRIMEVTKTPYNG